MFFEEMELGEIFKLLSFQWPELKIHWNSGARVVADRRALLIVLKNFLHNSVRHGGAREVSFKLQTLGNSKLQVDISDDGRGFKGNPQDLGLKILDSKVEGGSGIGLYLSKDLVEQMNGSLEFPEQVPGRGFRVSLFLHGSLKG